MKLKSNFSLGLDFKPLSPWPDTVPALALDNELICGFELSDDHPVFEHAIGDHEFNTNLFKSIYPQLTLSELARFYHSPAFKKYFQSELLFKAYNLQISPEVLEILSVLVSLPKEFQNFVSLKKISAQELYPLASLTKEQQIFVASEMVNSLDSKQESVKRLEYLSDLIQMNFSMENLKSLKLTELHQKRFPVTSGRDQGLQSSQLPWLSQIKTQFKRRGDKAGFEVQFFAGTPAELNKLAQNLNRVADAWNSKP